MARVPGEILKPILDYLAGLPAGECARIADIHEAVERTLGEQLDQSRTRGNLNRHSSDKLKNPRIERCAMGTYRLRGR